jgi:hypothetical protein
MSNNVGGVSLDSPLYQCSTCLEHNKLPLMFHVSREAAEKAGEDNKNPILVHQTCVSCLINWVQYGKGGCPECRVSVGLLAYRVINSDSELAELNVCKMPTLNSLSRLELVEKPSRLKKLLINIYKFGPICLLCCLSILLVRLSTYLVVEFFLLPLIFKPLVAILCCVMPEIVAVIILIGLIVACRRLLGSLVTHIAAVIFIIMWMGAQCLRPTYVGRKIEAMCISLYSRLSTSVAQVWHVVPGAPSSFALPAPLS